MNKARLFRKHAKDIKFSHLYINYGNEYVIIMEHPIWQDRWGNIHLYPTRVCLDGVVVRGTQEYSHYTEYLDEHSKIS